jgi:hypothetical protein
MLVPSVLASFSVDASSLPAPLLPRRAAGDGALQQGEEEEEAEEEAQEEEAGQEAEEEDGAAVCGAWVSSSSLIKSSSSSIKSNSSSSSSSVSSSSSTTTTTTAAAAAAAAAAAGGGAAARPTPSPLAPGGPHMPTAAQRAQETFAYDLGAYPFHRLVHEMFRLCAAAPAADGGALPADSGDADVARRLAALHERLGGFKGRTNHSPFHKAYKQATSSHCSGGGKDDERGSASAQSAPAEALPPPPPPGLNHRFRGVYHEFVRGVVAPLLGCHPDDVYYQRTPTLRIVVPSAAAVGHKHCDYEYYHQPAEINFWIPLTPTYGTNTLFVESEPGRADFAPLACELGEAVKFWGNQCVHYTVANAEPTTRVSLDFRAVDKRRFNPHFVDKRGKRPGFQVPFYYADSAGGGAVRKAPVAAAPQPRR